MDEASASGAGDSKFESWAGHMPAFNQALFAGLLDGNSICTGRFEWLVCCGHGWFGACARQQKSRSSHTWLHPSTAGVRGPREGGLAVDIRYMGFYFAGLFEIV